MKTYLDALQEVLENGEVREDRTGVGTISLFGMQQRYDLRKGFQRQGADHARNARRQRPSKQCVSVNRRDGQSRQDLRKSILA